ncbi:hypothetical protein IV203_029525 [Nitzschia inconspicua]|uniref:Uncharacterized protein n=1 Tax=Nitzschia inconspicua TaxID=303405 RepID=A0A9K3LRU3_9STRA|nr:hypothetical protein IV203_029525 [Nitzschia inconspicua]
MKLSVAVALIASGSFVEVSSGEWLSVKGARSTVYSLKGFRQGIQVAGRRSTATQIKRRTRKLRECGICVDSVERRALQDYYTQCYLDTNNCDLKGHGYYGCDCSGFDSEANTGSLTCTIYEDYQEGICGDFKITDNLTYDGAKVYCCYSLKEPFEIELCYRFQEDNSCDVLVGDETCSSCDIVDVDNADILGYPLSNYLSFDCTNTLAKVIGNDCLGSYLVDGLFSLSNGSSVPHSPAPDDRFETIEFKMINCLEAVLQTPSSSPNISNQRPSNDSNTHAPSCEGACSTNDSLKDHPSEPPILFPTHLSSSKPSSIPSAVQSENPSATPTTSLSLHPTSFSTVTPSVLPTAAPSLQPSSTPSNNTFLPAVSRSDFTLKPSSLRTRTPLDPSIGPPSWSLSSSGARNDIISNGLGMLLLLSSWLCLL